jgi:hypothetical protein
VAMHMTRRLLAVAGPASRGFKSKATEMAKKQKAAAAASKTGGRDPYALFKEAIASQPDRAARAEAKMAPEEYQQHRAAYSREKMLEVCATPLRRAVRSCALPPLTVPRPLPVGPVESPHQWALHPVDQYAQGGMCTWRLLPSRPCVACAHECCGAHARRRSTRCPRLCRRRRGNQTTHSSPSSGASSPRRRPSPTIRPSSHEQRRRSEA